MPSGIGYAQEVFHASMPLSLGTGKVFHLDGAGTNCETDVLVVL